MMEETKKIEKQENDFGITFNFTPDKNNNIDSNEIATTSKVLAANDLIKEGYIEDALNIMINLDGYNS